MVFALVVATLVAILAGSLAFMAQILWGTRNSRAQDQALRELLLARGSMTPLEAAAALGISVPAADRRLRRLVDDQRVKMEIDLSIGALRFALVGAQGPLRASPTPAKLEGNPAKVVVPSRKTPSAAR